jgi:predicted nuclease of restriction endonuclease-like (RecB) superfamily
MASIRVGHYEVGRKQLLESRDAMKAARPVWRGDDGKGVKSHLASVLPYFLTISNDAQERELEAALVSHIRDFLLELGLGFAFLGSQYPIEVSGKTYYLDMLFYHIRLRCFIVIELKMGDFEPEYSGKMNFYVSAVDDLLRHETDNPTIGLILCRSKDKTTAEYALRNVNTPIGVTTHRLSRSQIHSRIGK